MFVPPSGLNCSKLWVKKVFGGLIFSLIPFPVGKRLFQKKIYLYNMKKSIVTIPLVHIFFLLMFFLITNFIIEKQTRDKNGLSEFLYKLDFFLSNDFVTMILISLIVTPFGLSLFSIVKKRKDLIIGSLLSCLTSLLLITLFILT